MVISNGYDKLPEAISKRDLGMFKACHQTWMVGRLDTCFGFYFVHCFCQSSAGQRILVKSLTLQRLLPAVTRGGSHNTTATQVLNRFLQYIFNKKQFNIRPKMRNGKPIKFYNRVTKISHLGKLYIIHLPSGYLR